MRISLTLLCASAVLAASGAAHAGDRYGAPGDSAAAARAPDYNGPMLGWKNKSDAVNAAAPVTPVAPTAPAPLSDWAKRTNTISRPTAQAAPHPSAAPPAPALPTSLYDAPPAQVAANAAPAPSSATDAYHPVRPTGEVVTLSLADLPPSGPSLERQQAAEDEAQVMAAQIARANAQAVQDRAAGKTVSSATTDLLGGPQ